MVKTPSHQKANHVINNKSSMLYWWPLVKDVPVPKPETVVVETGYTALVGMLDGKPLPDNVRKRILATARQIGYPLFVRTDQASGKFDWKSACFVESEEKLFRNIYNIVEFNELADLMGLRPEALVFRKYIPLEAGFKAFYGGMPVAKERRYFIRDGKVECHHPYWVEDAISKWWRRAKEVAAVRPDKIEPLPENWKEILAKVNRETPEEVELLTSYAEENGKVIDGYWSVDFAMGKDGVWYFIDMAEGEKSWHPECRHNPKTKIQKETGV